MNFPIVFVGGIPDHAHRADVDTAHAHGRPGPEALNVREAHFVLDLAFEKLAFLADHEDDAADGDEPGEHEGAYFDFTARGHEVSLRQVLRVPAAESRPARRASKSGRGAERPAFLAGAQPRLGFGHLGRRV